MLKSKSVNLVESHIINIVMHHINTTSCKNKRTYDCQYDGLVSMGPCFFEAPIYFARPNFKGVDENILGLVDKNTVAGNISEKQSFWLDPVSEEEPFKFASEAREIINLND